ncbi:hypothetical protein C8F01DRAFT_1259015 [Mycena amicta]|nr:hypothetical protein C8F01DRAFT_1259015 [Mycena amicta]
MASSSDNPIEIFDDDDQPALQLSKPVADLIPSRALAIGRLLQLDLPPMDELNDANGYEFTADDVREDSERQQSVKPMTSTSRCARKACQGVATLNAVRGKAEVPIF